MVRCSPPAGALGTGALIGLGAAIKLWPALLIPSFLAYRPDRKPAGLASWSSGSAWPLISLLTGGWSRLFSPLTWQSDRGLQIESIWATPLMVARAVRPASWIVDNSEFQAYEIFGPGVRPGWSSATSPPCRTARHRACSFVRAFRAGGSTPVAVGFLVLATVAIMIVTNKTFSPQYLLWFGGPRRLAAAGLGASARRASGNPPDRCAAAAARPADPSGLPAALRRPARPRRGGAMIVVATLVTALRNVALVAVHRRGLPDGLAVPGCWTTRSPGR